MARSTLPALLEALALLGAKVELWRGQGLSASRLAERTQGELLKIRKEVEKMIHSTGQKAAEEMLGILLRLDDDLRDL